MSAETQWKTGPDALTKPTPVWGAQVGSPQVESTDYTPISSDYAPDVPLVAYPSPEARQVWGPPPGWTPPEPPPPPPKPEPLRLETPEEVSAEITSLYQRVHDGMITSLEAKRRVDILMARKEIIETVEFAKRVRELERKVR